MFSDRAARGCLEGERERKLRDSLAAAANVSYTVAIFAQELERVGARTFRRKERSAAPEAFPHAPRAMETESVMDKFRAATEKVMIVNTIRHPGLGSGIGRADLGKALKHS